jgi:hypothetical protein
LAVVAGRLCRAAGSIAITWLISLPSRLLSGRRTEAAPARAIISVLRCAGILRRGLLDILPSTGLHTLRLGRSAVELATLYRTRLLMGKESLVDVAPRDGSRLPVRKTHILRTRGERHLPADYPGVADLNGAGADDMVETPTLEIVGRDRADTIAVLRISIYVCDIYVRNIN